jgi:hypothetical protein
MAKKGQVSTLGPGRPGRHPTTSTPQLAPFVHADLKRE